MARKQLRTKRAGKHVVRRSARPTHSTAKERINSCSLDANTDQHGGCSKDHSMLKELARVTCNSDDLRLIRIIFPNSSRSRGSKLQEITWKEFVEQCDDEMLAMIYQDELAGCATSYFCRLAERETSRRAAVKQYLPSTSP